MGRVRVATKIIGLFALFTLGIIWIVGLMGRSWIVREIERSATSHLHDNTKGVINIIAENEKTLITNAKVLAGNYTVGRLAQDRNRRGLRTELLPYKSILKLDIIETQDTNSKVLLNASGPFPEDTSLTHLSLVKNGLMEMEMADLIETPSGWALCAVAPTRSPSGVSGLLMIGSYFNNAFLKEVKKDVEDVEITIYVDSNAIATTLTDEKNNKPLQNLRLDLRLNKEVLQEDKTIIRTELIDDIHYQASYTPLKLHQENIGVLSVRYSMEKVVAAKARAAVLNVSFTLLIILAMIVIGYGISKGITNRIEKLARAADRIARGDFNQQIEIGSEDEIGKLAHSFARMVENLRQEKERVESRTAALTRKIAELTSLHEVSQVLMSSTLEPQVLLEKILASAMGLLNADSASVMLLDEQTGELRINVAQGLSKEIIQKTKVKVGEGIAGWVAREGKPLLITDSENPLIKITPRRKKIKSAISTPIKIKDKVIGVINVSNPQSSAIFDQDDVTILSTLSAQAAAVIENARLFETLHKTYVDTVKALAAAIDAKDPYTRGHSERVAEYAIAICKKINLSEESKREIETAAFLHDIGKIGIDDKILQKPGKLSKEEMEIIKTHSQISINILTNIDFPWAILASVRHHHERYDGNGYPNGLKGEEISLGARILAVADAFEAMTSDRPYRSALSKQKAIEELKKCSGKQFDPKIVKAFLKVLKEKSIIKSEVAVEV